MCAVGGQQKSRGRKGSEVGRKRPGEEVVVHVGWFSCLGQMPFSLAAHSLLLLCLHLSKKKMLMRLFIQYLRSIFQ